MVSSPRTGARSAVTLVEMMIVLAIIATISSIAVVRYVSAIEESKETVAIKELQDLHAEILFYEQQTGSLPLSLEDLGHGTPLDPWGCPYQYLNFATLKGKGNGAKRKDRFIVPLNSKFDLYSKGPDGKSKAPLTAAESRDDIVVANDGDFVGLATLY